MKTKRRPVRPVLQIELNTEAIVDAIVAKLRPFLTGKAKADRDTVSGEGLEEFCASVGISRTKAKQEIAEGKLDARKVGKKVLITADAKRAWLASLPASVTKQTPKKTSEAPASPCLPHQSCGNPLTNSVEMGAKRG
jgi:hypothetical protein